MPALRLKTKLVFAITGMVLAIVVTLSTLYFAEVLRMGMLQTLHDGQEIAHNILDVARQSLEIDLSATKIDINDPRQVEDAIAEILSTDPGLNDLLESFVSYSPNIRDVAIVSVGGRALVHSSPSLT